MILPMNEDAGVSVSFPASPAGKPRRVDFFTRPKPLVTLVDLSDPRVVGMATRGYAGLYSQEMTEDEFAQYWAELDLTKLKTPLEMVHATFLIKRVTRSFTHQMVRYRIGTSFVQESMRFSVQDTAGILVPTEVAVDHIALKSYVETVSATMRAYWGMIDAGGKTEDARSLLPHAITTNLFAQFSLLTLANIYKQRTCCQAQEGEWGAVVGAMRKELAKKSDKCAEALRTPWQEPGVFGCGYGASFDRPCIHQAVFDRNFERYKETRP
jgi:flavin-dependent thymidylate synthase